LKLVGLSIGDTLDVVPLEVTVTALVTLLGDDVGDPLLLGAATWVMVVDRAGDMH
jgi:hypothetical protein